MTLPTVYTESGLNLYMRETLGGIATTLGLESSDFVETVNDVLAAYGVSTIADATDIVKLRALAKVGALRRAQIAALSWYDFSADGGSFSRSQVQAQIKAMLQAAETDAIPYADVYAVTTATMTYTTAADPYQWTDNDADGI